MNQTLMFVVFFLSISSLFGLMQYRLYRLVRTWMRKVYAEQEWQPRLKRIKRILLGLNILFLLQFLVRGSGVYQNPFVQVLLIYPMGLFFALVVLSFLLVTVGDVLRFFFWGSRKLVQRADASDRVTSSDGVDIARRRFLKLGGYSAAAMTGSIPLIASFATARDYQINRLDLRFPRLPSSLDGLTIAHVSDIHSGVFMTERNMEEIFELVNSLNPQMITITGDFVDSSNSQIEPIYKAIGMLTAEEGIYGCLGNHDHFATATRVSSAMEQRGVIMLNNTKSNGAAGGALTIAGIDDAGRGGANFANLDNALQGVDPESFTIMLSHRPDVWDTVRARGADLTLAGHTHGGQVGFRLGPLNLNPVYLVHKYPMGHYEEAGKHLYVNVGVGMVGVPIRMVKPEIALLTLRSA